MVRKKNSLRKPVFIFEIATYVILLLGVPSLYKGF